MDDRVSDETQDDVDVPLPRRAPGPSRIVEAHHRLFGEDPAADGDGGAAPTVVERRERSAALAHAATARRAGSVTSGPAEGADDDEEPAVDVPADDTGPGERPDGRPPRRAPWSLVAAAVLLVFLVGAFVGFLVAPSDAPAAAAPPVRPVLSGDVVRVIDAGRLTVLVDDRPVEVAVLGLDPPRAAPDGSTPCGTATATTLAADSLAGRRVTLVPDAVGAEFDPDGRRWAYVVLATQQNYTDLALLQGAARWDTSRAVTYGEVFAREEAEARRASAGIWGAPCFATP